MNNWYKVQVGIQWNKYDWTDEKGKHYKMNKNLKHSAGKIFNFRIELFPKGLTLSLWAVLCLSNSNNIAKF